MKQYFLPLAAAALLTACGGGGGQGGDQAADANATANTAANTASTAFFASILNLVNNKSETDQLVSADSIALDASETLGANPL